MNPTVVAETERLRLRRFAPEDLDALAELVADPEVMRFSLLRRPLTREEARTMLAERIFASYASEGFGLWAVEWKRDGRCIGFCGLIVQDLEGQREIEIGYRLARVFWGRGVATEAARAARCEAFGRLGLARVISLIEPDNAASIRVAEKNGMRLEREIIKWDRPVGVYAVERERPRNTRKDAKEEETGRS